MKTKEIYPDIAITDYSFNGTGGVIKTRSFVFGALTWVRILNIKNGKYYLVLHKKSIESHRDKIPEDIKIDLINKLHAMAYLSSVLFEFPDVVDDNSLYLLDENQESETDRISKYTL